MRYMSIRQVSEKWGISVRQIQVLCSEGRIAGAIKVGSYWAIPENTNKPKDKGIKIRKYIKNRAED
ncbi:MAG: helix-turn-helix domain-containing protein [Lactobacillus iners]|uniref:DNA-binding protein n=1 Tax=Gardnerella vaginalis TaxID=2702 RepID=UPI001573B5B8|nr:DNA-binding protein [Gardnerella vaginalis]MCT7780760.1 helix-turn-helix domain-containing protein [Lactobacillus iners]MCT7782664.1 helix-turn-helix domain-containing protein [Lactobacillus iners]NSX27747.1 DNA-binding protein [Gardnerella vaginalis]